MSDKAKSLLLLNSSGPDCANSILFQIAAYWAYRGQRVLFVSKSPFDSLPFGLGKPNIFYYPEVLQLIQFQYLPNWEELVRQLYSIHMRHFPVSVIIVKNLEHYFKEDPKIHSHEDHIALICGSLFYAVSLCAKIVPPPVILIGEYVSEDSTIEQVVINNFFLNVWHLKRTDEKNFKLSKLCPPRNDQIVGFNFNENSEESVFDLDEVFKTILNAD